MSSTRTRCSRAYFEDLFERRRKTPGEDLITALLQVRDDARRALSDEELVANIHSCPPPATRPRPI